MKLTPTVKGGMVWEGSWVTALILSYLYATGCGTPVGVDRPGFTPPTPPPFLVGASLK